MNEKKVVPARGVMIGLAVVLLVWALSELVFAVATPIELANGSFPSFYVTLEIEAVIFTLLFLSLFVIFGVRILVRVSRIEPAVNELFLLGLAFNALVLIDQLTQWVSDGILSAKDSSFTVQWDIPLMVFYSLIDGALVVLFLLALIKGKSSTQSALILGIVSSGLMALRAFSGVISDAALMAKAGQTQALWVVSDLLPIAFATLMAVVFALTLSFNKRSAGLTNEMASPTSETMGEKNKTPETK